MLRIPETIHSFNEHLLNADNTLGAGGILLNMHTKIHALWSY